MAIKRRKGKAASDEGAKDAPSTTGGGPKFRQRTLPRKSILDNEDTELGTIVKKLREDGSYGSPFYLANDKRFVAPRVATGILALDLPLGGGWCMGRASMLYGEKSAGKSTLSLISIAAMHRKFPDAACAYIDTEGTFDKDWAEKLGVDLARLVLIEPDTGEQAVDLADAVMRAAEIRLVVTDSIAALVPMKEIEESASQDFMGLQARLIGKYVRKTTNAMLSERKHGHYVHLMHLNQFRMKIGIMFGDPRTLPGGKALEYATTQQFEVKNKEQMEKIDGENVVKLNEHNLKVTKNKGGGPLKESMFRLIRTPHDGMPEGWVDQAKAVFSHGSRVGVVQGTKTSFTIDGINHKFRGAPDFNRWAVDNRTEYYEAMDKIIAGYRKLWNLS